uniref:Uncharacterized protein n=1 Tax=Acrobeloides nanus TaxID=290746 RepID=A0A914E6Q5_9BILA
MKMCSHPGSDVEFLRIVLKIAGIDYEVVQHNYLTQELIPALNNGSVDMSLVALRAELKYYLTVPLRHGVAFHDLQEVLDAMEYQGWIGVQNVNGYGPGLYCKPEQCEQFERIKAKGRLIVLPQDDDVGLTEELMKGHRVGFAAFTLDLAPADISVYDRQRRTLFIRDSKMSTEMLAFAMNPNLTLELELINRALSEVLCSYATVRGRYVPPYNAYRDEVDTDYVVLTNIHLKDVYNMVFILIGVAAKSIRLRWDSNPGPLDSNLGALPLSQVHDKNCDF